MSEDLKTENLEEVVEENATTEEENKAAVEKAAGKAKQNKKAIKEGREKRKTEELAEATKKSNAEKKERAAGEKQIFLFVGTLKCDGVTYLAGREYPLTSAVEDIARNAGCIV